MTFIEADKKLSEMFPDRYRSVKFEQSRNAQGQITEIECYLYAEGRGIFFGRTFDEAFASLEDKPSPMQTSEGIIDERP
jgi:folate-dependent tRNA-U54 methylase TrmFO/GidA